jgi:hypothetical protein
LNGWDIDFLVRQAHDGRNIPGYESLTSMHQKDVDHDFTKHIHYHYRNGVSLLQYYVLTENLYFQIPYTPRHTPTVYSDPIIELEDEDKTPTGRRVLGSENGSSDSMVSVSDSPMPESRIMRDVDIVRPLPSIEETTDEI